MISGIRAVRVALTLLYLSALCFAAEDAVSQARERVRADKPEEAIQILRDAVKKDPADAETSAYLVHVLIGQEDFAGAEAEATRALAVKPDSAALHVAAGDLRFRQGLLIKAEAEYKAAFKIDPKNARALYGIARIFDAASLQAKALNLYRAAAQAAPDDPVVRSMTEREEARTAANVAKWKEEVAKAEDKNSRRMRYLSRQIAIAEAIGERRPFELATPYRAYSLHILPLMNGQALTSFGMPIQVNGVKTMLELDTGAGGILINEKTAARAGVRKLAPYQVSGLGNQGPVEGYLGYAEHINIGDLDFKNCLVEVTPQSEGQSDGLIGTDVFARFLVTIAFSSGRLELSPLPGPAWDGVTAVDRYTGPELKGFAQVFRFGHWMMIPTKVSDDSEGLFLIDTGAVRTLVSTNLAPNLTSVRDNDRVRIKGLAGNVRKVYSADDLTLEFATFRQKNLDVITVDLSKESRHMGVEVSGILGFSVLRMFNLTLDYRDGMVKFDYLNH